MSSKKKDRKKSLDIKKVNTTVTQAEDITPADTSEERVKQLEDDLLKFRIENAYLKELRRLHLEEETLLKKQRGLSTAFEENSN